MCDKQETPIIQPNRTTVAAMLEAESIAIDQAVNGYDDLDKLFAELEKVKSE